MKWIAIIAGLLLRVALVTIIMPEVAIVDVIIGVVGMGLAALGAFKKL